MTRDRDDIDVDARLRRALAHAPDAQVEPSTALDQAILRAAHAALPKPAATERSNESHGVFASLRRWWAHPAAAPVFAVLALSTVIVSMWTRHGVPSPTADADAETVAATPAGELPKGSRVTAVGTGTDAATPSAATNAAPAPAVEERMREQAEKARSQAKTPAAAPPSSLNEVQASREDAGRRNVDKKADPAPPPKEAGPRARQEAAVAQREVDRVEQVAPAPSSLLDAAPASAAPVTPADKPRAPAIARAPASPTPSPIRSAEERSAAAGAPMMSAPTSTTDNSASAPSAAKPAPVGAIASDVAPPAAGFAPGRDASLESRVMGLDAPPLARALDAAATWQWRADASKPPVEIDDRARAWFARLMAASQGRWERADPVPARSLRSSLPDGTGPTSQRHGTEPEAKSQRPPDARTFELWREQAQWATIVVGASDVTWRDASGRMWRAPLAANVLAALRNW